jgi:hypothetical protein
MKLRLQSMKPTPRAYGKAAGEYMVEREKEPELVEVKAPEGTDESLTPKEAANALTKWRAEQEATARRWMTRLASMPRSHRPKR